MQLITRSPPAEMCVMYLGYVSSQQLCLQRINQTPMEEEKQENDERPSKEPRKGYSNGNHREDRTPERTET